MDNILVYFRCGTPVTIESPLHPPLHPGSFVFDTDTLALYLDLDIDDIENNFIKIKQDLLLVIRRLKTLFYLEDKDIELYFSGRQDEERVFFDDYYIKLDIDDISNLKLQEEEVESVCWMTKDEIIEFYINNIYFGNGFYGKLASCFGSWYGA